MELCKYINQLRINYHINQSSNGIISDNRYHARLALDIAKKTCDKKLMRAAESALVNVSLDE